jgi:hypothetical protein
VFEFDPSIESVLLLLCQTNTGSTHTHGSFFDIRTTLRTCIQHRSIRTRTMLHYHSIGRSRLRCLRVVTAGSRTVVRHSSVNRTSAAVSDNRFHQGTTLTTTTTTTRGVVAAQPPLPHLRFFSSSSSSDVESRRIHYPVIAKSNHGPYQEFSVIHTDRSLNLMSAPFQQVMRDLNALLCHTYSAAATAIIPGYVLQCVCDSVCVCFAVCVCWQCRLLVGSVWLTSRVCHTVQGTCCG